MVHGRYGELRVLVDGETVVDAGLLAVVGAAPSVRKVLAGVRERLASSAAGGGETQ